MAETITAVFRAQPIVIESEAQGQGSNSGSVVTLTSRINDPGFTKELMGIAERWCTWIHTKYGREADARLENNQITCTVGVQADHLGEDVLPELLRRLTSQGGRSMGATAGTGTGTGDDYYPSTTGPDISNNPGV